jgi:CRP-like cAMP-binding protein
MDADTLLASLGSHPFAEKMSPRHLEKLASMAVETTFEKNQTIFREGDQAAFFYLIVSGTVGIEVMLPGRAVRIQTLGPGDELGWSSVLEERPKYFAACALEPVRALALDGVHMRQACREDPEFGYVFIAQVLEVVASRLQATRMQLLDVYSPEGAKKP